MTTKSVATYILILSVGFLITAITVKYVPTDTMEYNEYCLQRWSGLPFPVRNTVEQYNFAGPDNSTIFAECIPIVERTFLWEFFILNSLLYAAFILIIGRLLSKFKHAAQGRDFY